VLPQNLDDGQDVINYFDAQETSFVVTI